LQVATTSLQVRIALDPSANARDRLPALKELLNLDAHPGAPSVVQVFFGPGVDGEMPRTASITGGTLASRP
jgi:hypothetical protein